MGWFLIICYLQHRFRKGNLFEKKNHPKGEIGKNHKSATEKKRQGKQKLALHRNIMNVMIIEKIIDYG